MDRKDKKASIRLMLFIAAVVVFVIGRVVADSVMSSCAMGYCLGFFTARAITVWRW